MASDCRRSRSRRQRTDGAQLAPFVPRAGGEATGLSQVRFAQLAEMDTTTLNRIVNGRTDPTALTLLKIARAAGMPVSELLRDIG